MFGSFAASRPLCGGEQPWTYFDEPRNHPEDGNLVPEFSFAGAKTLLVEIAGYAGEGEILNHQVHHLGEHHSFARMKLQPQAVVGNAKAVRDLFLKRPLTRCFVSWQLAPPLDRH